MSVFTDKELDYLTGQRLGRIATVGAGGQVGANARSVGAA